MDDTHLNANRTLWDAWARAHHDQPSRFYDVARFKAGENTLTPVELEELGDVSGKSLLHLQCHFGLDTLSWARLGATVTGVDFAPEAIRLAREVAADLALAAETGRPEFVCTNLYDLPDVLGERQYDLVFTSYGVLFWLPDLAAWAALVARYLKPGGTFYIVEFHPFKAVVDFERDTLAPRLIDDYFRTGVISETAPNSYAAETAEYTSYEWLHTLGEIVTALCQAGLRIDFLHEFPYATYGIWDAQEQGTDGLWRLRGHDGAIPQMFSIRATRPSAS